MKNLLFKSFLVGLLLAGNYNHVVAADGTIETWTGKGSRRDTVEMELRSSSLGTAADLIPGTDGSGNLGTAANSWANVDSDDLTVNDDITVSDDLTINGDTTVGNAAGDVLDVNGTSVTIDSTWGLLFSTSTSGGTRMFFLDGANQRVGIANTAPSVALDVTGAVTLSGALTANGNIAAGSNGDDTFDFNVTSAAIDSAYGLHITTTTNGTGTSILMLDGSNKRVGINDSTPDAALDVGGNVQLDGNLTVGDLNTENDTITVNSSSMTIGSSFGLRIATATSGGTVMLQLDGANRRVGIGTSAPSVLFHVNGAATIGSTATDVITFTGMPLLPQDAAPRTNLTAGATFQMVINTGATPDEVCIATGTTAANQWTLLSNLATACSN